MGFGNHAFVDRRVARDATVSLNGRRCGILSGLFLSLDGNERREATFSDMTRFVVGPECEDPGHPGALVPSRAACPRGGHR